MKSMKNYLCVMLGNVEDRWDLGVDNEKIVLPQEGALVFWGSRVNVGRWGKNSFLLAHNTNRWHFIHCFQCKVQLTLQCSHCAQSWEWTVGARYRARKEHRVWRREDIEGSAIEPQVLRSLPPNPHLPSSNVASRTFVHTQSSSRNQHFLPSDPKIWPIVHWRSSQKDPDSPEFSKYQ